MYDLAMPLILFTTVCCS